MKIDVNKQSDVSESYVVNGQEVTYTITASNLGTEQGTATISDTPPNGTTFVENSIKINGVDSPQYTLQNLQEGINVSIPMSSTATLSFKVIINDLENSTIITNTAHLIDTTLSNNPQSKTSNEVSFEYVEPIISQLKSMQTENGNDYVVNGEKITYTISISNDGGIGKNVLVKDQIPIGTTFVEESIKVNGEKATVGEGMIPTQSSLEEGLVLQIPAYTENQTISFDVIVNDLDDEDWIRNIASVDNVETNEVEIIYSEPIINFYKEMLTENKKDFVVRGEKITYNIVIENKGTLGKDVLVKDLIPENTAFVDGSVKINGNTTTLSGKDIVPDDLKNGITLSVPSRQNKELSNDNPDNEENSNDSQEENSNTDTRTDNDNNEGIVYSIYDEYSSKNFDETDSEQDEWNKKYFVGKTVLSFDVIVNDLDDEDWIRNIATVDDVETNEVSIIYYEPIISELKNASTEYSKDYVVGNEIITYEIVVKNKGNLEKTSTIKDLIPEGTEFVEGSIKVNDDKFEKLTAKDLKNGIKVLVPPKYKNDIPKDEEYTDTNDVNQDGNMQDVENQDSENTLLDNESENLNYYDEPSSKYITMDNTDLYKKYINLKNYDENLNSISNKINNDALSNTDDNSNDLENGLDNPNTQDSENPPDDNNLDDGNRNTEDIGKPQDEYLPGTTVLSFKVKVIPLEKDTDTFKIINIATVDDVETNEVVHNVRAFNMKLDKIIKNISLNNSPKDVENPKTGKADIKAKEINSSSLVVTYGLTITNTGSVEGTSTVEETIPDGFIVSSSNPSYWSNSSNGLTTTTDIIKPGESKELEISLEWVKNQENFGEKIATAKIISTNNESNAEETTLEDNSSDASMIVSIHSGFSRLQIQITLIITICISILGTGIFLIKNYILY